MDKVPINIEKKDMPKDRTTSSPYFFKGRTSGGFADALFLGSLILTCGVWIMLFIIAGGK